MKSLERYRPLHLLGLLGVAALLALAATLAAGTAGATHVVPTPVAGNPTCSDLQGSGQTWIEIKADPPGNGVFSDANVSVTVSNFTPNSFDWSMTSSVTVGLDAVFVKAGNAGNLYVYDPGPGEATADTGLVTPDVQAISHILFCYDVDPATPTPTPTATDTPTPTPTDTPTPTPTDTPTPTPTDTPTPTPTDTPTPTPTDTATATPTDTATPTPTDTPTPVLEGCTPGYWKQPQHFDSWEGFATDETLEAVFNVPNAFGLDEKTLLEALSFKGGSEPAGAAQILLRAAVAALLNAASPDVNYPLSIGDVISQVNAALASNSRSTMLALASVLNANNNLGCPLN